MALTTQTGIINNAHEKDSTPEVEVRFDSEGKGYLFRKDKQKEIVIEEPKVEPILEEVKEEIIKEVPAKKVKRGKK